MDFDFRSLILEQLSLHGVMALATVRRDGWPQATTVFYANDGLLVCSLIGRNTQKYLNLTLNPRASVTIGTNCIELLQLKGLSLSGHVSISEKTAEIERVHEMVLQRNPQFGTLPPPDPSRIVALRITPEFVSIIDYSKGLGHSDLVTVKPDGPVDFIESCRHHWAGLQAK